MTTQEMNYKITGIDKAEIFKGTALELGTVLNLPERFFKTTSHLSGVKKDGSDSVVEFRAVLPGPQMNQFRGQVVKLYQQKLSELSV